MPAWLGFGMGAVILAVPASHLPAKVLRLGPAHVELLLVGWMVQLALGVAFWILPRDRFGSRGNERVASAAALLLNVGVLAAGIAAAFAGQGWRSARLYSSLKSPSTETA